MSPPPRDVYERLKLIENRLIEWEREKQSMPPRTCPHPCQLCMSAMVTPISSAMATSSGTTPSSVARPLVKGSSGLLIKKRKMDGRLSDDDIKKSVKLSVRTVESLEKANNDNIEQRLQQLREQLLKKGKSST